MEKKTAAYTLVIDKDRDAAMAIVFSFLHNNGHLPELHEWLRDEGLFEAYASLQKEKSAKQHELGWCEAPDCEHGK